ncbi:hypothetical protein QBC41DRAFT_336457 [Cercophora samala]|uniref:Uncharacterized protein n=1 Tax=Cercophora samala TaxID=330535 RepID=A0AA39ZF02_9PEZI|nr:hypothetical protein QBC41DRAFT_336457 [Cercophora samala]
MDGKRDTTQGPRGKRTEALIQQLRAASHAGSNAQKEHLKGLDSAGKQHELSMAVRGAQEALAEFQKEEQSRKAEQGELERLCQTAVPLIEQVKNGVDQKERFLQSRTPEAAKLMLNLAYRYSLMPQYEGLLSQNSTRLLAAKGATAPIEAQLRGQLDVLRERIARRDSTILKLQTEVKGVKTQLADSEKEVQSLQDKVGDATRRLSYNATEIDALKTRVSKAERLEVEVDAKNNVISKQIREVNDLARKISHLKRQLSEKDVELAEVTRDSSSKDRTVEKLEKRSAELWKDIEELEGAKSDLQHTQRLRKKEIARLQAAVDGLKKERAEEATGFCQRIQAQAEEMTQLTEQLENVTNYNHELAAIKDQQAGEIAKLQLKLRETIEAATKSKQKLEAVSKGQIEELQRGLKRHSANEVDLKRKLRETKDEVETKRQRLVETEQQLRTLLEHLAAVSKIDAPTGEWDEFARAVMEPNTVALKDAELELWYIEEPWGDGVEAAQPLEGYTMAHVVMDLYMSVRQQRWDGNTFWLAHELCELLAYEPTVDFATVELVFREWSHVIQRVERQHWTVLLQSVWYALAHAAYILIERWPCDGVEKTSLMEWRNVFADRITSPFLKEQLLGMVNDETDRCREMGGTLIVLDNDAVSGQASILLVDRQAKTIRPTRRVCWDWASDGIAATVSPGEANAPILFDVRGKPDDFR